MTVIPQLKIKIMTAFKNILLLTLVASGSAMAQTEQAAGPVKATAPDILMNQSAWLFAFTFVILIIVIVVMARSIKVLSKALLAKEGVVDSIANEEEAEEYQVTAWGRLMNALTRSVPVAQEEDVMLHHNYDGIRELDNKLPPWWVWGFYATIAFAFVYIFYFHLSGSGKLSAAEYTEQMRMAEVEHQKRIAANANYVTEANVVALKDDAAITEGASNYQKLCLACHGDKGQGLVGPNLTDQYWIHGGDIKSIFKTITEGVPAKGMISWKAQLSPKQIQQLASYILTLEGTNPPGAKEPQGTLYTATTDSTATGTADSVITATNQPDSTIQSAK